MWLLNADMNKPSYLMKPNMASKLVPSPVVILSLHGGGLGQRQVAVDLQQRPLLQKFCDGSVLEDEVERNQTLEVCPASPEVRDDGQGPAEVVGRR